MRSNTAPAWLVLVICCVTVGRAALSFCLLSARGRQHAVAKRFNMAAAVGALAHVLQMACCRASVQISLPLAPPRVCCNDVYHGLLSNPPCRLPPGFATRGPAIISVSRCLATHGPQCMREMALRSRNLNQAYEQWCR